MSDASEAWDQAWHDSLDPPPGGGGTAAAWYQLLGAAVPRVPRADGLWELCEDAAGLWELCGDAGRELGSTPRCECLWELGADLLETFGAGLAKVGLVAALHGEAAVPGVVLATAPTILAAPVAVPAPGAPFATAVRTVDANMSPATLATANANEEGPNNSLLSMMFPGYLGVRSALGVLTVLECVGFGVSLAVGAMVGDPAGFCTVYHLGAAWAPAMAQGGWWRLLAQIFLHGSFQHLLSNIIFQCRLGFALESELGSSRFCVLYLLSGVLGNLFSAAMDPVKLSVGASGSAFAMLGASIIQLVTGWASIEPTARQGRVLVYALMVPTLFMDQGMDRWCHVGGCVTGGLMYLLLSPKLDRAPSTRLARPWVAASIFGLSLADIATVLRLDWHAVPQLPCGASLHLGSVFAAA